MKKIRFIGLIGLLLCSSLYAHTSIHFSINQGSPMLINDYEDMLFMEQIQAQRFQQRIMRMRYSQMRHHRSVFIEPRYSDYYYARSHTHCHRHYC